eukprot:scaffold16.g46.t1
MGHPAKPPGGLRLRSLLLVAGLVLLAMGFFNLARTGLLASPPPVDTPPVPRRDVLAVQQQPEALLRPCNPDPLFQQQVAADEAAADEQQQQQEQEAQQGPDDFFIKKWRLPREWRKKIIAAIPLSKGGIPYIRASRTWRKGIRAVFVADFIPSPDVVAAGAGHGERFVFLNTSLIPTPKKVPNYYGKAAMVPSMAHENGYDDYQARARRLRQGGAGGAGAGAGRGGCAAAGEARGRAMRERECDACGWGARVDAVWRRRHTVERGPVNEPRMLFDPPLGCPYCSWELLAKVDAAQRPSIYTRDGQFQPRYPNVEPEGEILAHGGGGIILSVGLLRRLPLEYIHSCIKGNFSHGQIYGGDTMFSHCVFWTGVAPTDPGYYFHDHHYNTFDHGGQLLLPIVSEYYRYFKKGFPNNTTCCKKQCQARLAHTTTHHVRSLHFKEPEVAVDAMKMLVRLRDMYLHIRSVAKRKGGHAKLPELWDNHKSESEEGSSPPYRIAAKVGNRVPWQGARQRRRRVAALAALAGFALGASVVLLLHPKGTQRIVAGDRMRILDLRAPVPPPLPPFLRQPWPHQLLPPDALARGLAPLGSGARMARLASKLLAGQPATVVLLGGSVTFGSGATWWGSAFPALFFDWLQKSFPDSNLTLLNRSIPASTSGLTAMCSERLVPQHADLVVLEFTQNDPPAQLLGTSPRFAPEVLMRKLLRMRAAPAVVLLHHYSWWFAKGEGRDGGLFTHPQTEAELTTLAAYYDAPSLSLRAAVHPLLRAGVPGFKVDRVTSNADPAYAQRMCDPDKVADYFYADGIHPSDQGHRALADLLIALVQRAAAAEAARRGEGGGGSAAEGGSSSSSAAEGGGSGSAAEGPGGSGSLLQGNATTAGGLAALGQRSLEVPPPLQAGVVDAPTSLCLMQARGAGTWARGREDFKGAVVRRRGFQFQPERPNATSFKWGWRGTEAGAWAELEIDTRETEAGGVEPRQPATVYLGYIRSWRGMGRARVECMRGCRCEPTTIDGAWRRKATLRQTHTFLASQAAACRLRVTILRATPAEQRKVVLSSVMVSTVPAVNNAPEDAQGALYAGRQR